MGCRDSLVAINVFGPSNAGSRDDYFMRYIAMAVSILDEVKPEERPAWLDRLARPTYRYALRTEERSKRRHQRRRQENSAV